MDRTATVRSVVSHHLIEISIMSSAYEKVIQKRSDAAEHRVLGAGIFANRSFYHRQKLIDRMFFRAVKAKVTLLSTAELMSNSSGDIILMNRAEFGCLRLEITHNTSRVSSYRHIME